MLTVPSLTSSSAGFLENFQNFIRGKCYYKEHWWSLENKANLEKTLSISNVLVFDFAFFFLYGSQKSKLFFRLVFFFKGMSVCTILLQAPHASIHASINLFDGWRGCEGQATQDNRRIKGVKNELWTKKTKKQTAMLQVVLLPTSFCTICQLT